MDNDCRDLMHRIKQNDPTLQKLLIGNYSTSIANNSIAHDHHELFKFKSRDNGDYSKIGEYIGRNTYLYALAINLDGLMFGIGEGSGLYHGLKDNSSIRELTIFGWHTVHYTIIQKLLNVYQVNNLCLQYISFPEARIHGDEHIIASFLWSCINLQEINLNECNITDEQLTPIIEAKCGHPALKKLSLYHNRIGNIGCEAIAAMFEYPYFSLQRLDLSYNEINNEGVLAIATKLSHKRSTLKEFILDSNPIDWAGIDDGFFNTICNTSSISSIYLSNQSLEKLSDENLELGSKLTFLLGLNKGWNKSQVAKRKILQYHPNIDIEPLICWDSEGEWTLKALPYVIVWFKRASEAVDSSFDDDEGIFLLGDRSLVEGWRVIIGNRKLSAIYQFARTMPLLFIPVSHTKADKKKRKRDCM